ncbi:MAG TPA: DISARM system SNF2-like helicase DrmD [Planctomycetota bacterium]|nr:DISARM system SNF2-like helicase DrmD [Planctomycetota bacterium]
MTIAPPEPGQLVEIRRRKWVVTDVRSSGLARTNSCTPQHLVTLVSLDEDALNESLSAVWEVEPGARILETAGLPSLSGWDPCERLEAFLDAVRWGGATNADRFLLQAPFRSGVEIEDYQLDPLVRAIDMARANLLIADDVGLGKTIEAGLVIQELLVRHRARSILIVCPASLQVKWRTEMHEKFGLEFRIVDADYVKSLRRECGVHANPWTSFPRLIASVDWMKTGEGLRLIKDALPPHVTYPRKFDILIVDEAHNVAPSAASRYAMPSQRTRLIRLLAPHFEHRLFLTATPHNGYQESFTSLLELLDDQRFARGVMPDEKQLHRVMIRRMKTDLVDEKGEPIYPKRELRALEVDYTPEEREAHRLLREYTASRAGSHGDHFGVDFVHKLLKKRLFSSPRAFAATLAKHRQALAQRGAAREGRQFRERVLRKAILRAEEDYADEARAEEAEAEAVEAATELSSPLTDSQRSMLERMCSWAERAKNRPDSKAEALLRWLDEHLKTDGRVNHKRVIFFTEYRATHSWLHEVLTSRGWGGERLMVLHGGMDREEREKVKAAFQAHPSVSPVRILLATDAASEGIDLQNHCNYLIHIEIPWNPNVMEQRNGRIDRHGQKEKTVHIWHPVPKGIDFGRIREIASREGVRPGDLSSIEGEAEFIARAIVKLEQMREDLGIVGPVIAAQIEEGLLGRRIAIDTRDAEAKASKARRFIAAERRLQERIARLHARLIEARDGFRLTPDRVARAVSVALDIAGKPPLEPTALPGAPADAKAFNVPLLVGTWAEAARGLEHPHTGKRRPITFDHAVARGRDDVVLAHLNHRLVQMSLRLLRAEIWAHEDRRKLHRVAVRSVPATVLQEPVVIVWSRLVITGGGYHRLHEELTVAGGEMKASGFARIRTLTRLEELLSAGAPAEPTQKCFEALRRRFEAQKASILSAVHARSQERLEFLTNSLERRRQAEESDLAQVLEDLAAMIRRELEDTGKSVQLELWPPDQREQLRRDVEALRTRLERIPEEREKELAAIGRRYAAPAARTFPVAVEFVVPEGFAEDR